MKNWLKPEFAEVMINKTERKDKNGIEWDTVEPGDPWAEFMNNSRYFYKVGDKIFYDNGVTPDWES